MHSGNTPAVGTATDHSGNTPAVGTATDHSGNTPAVGTAADHRAGAPQHHKRRWLRHTAVAAVLVLFAVELTLGWRALTSALSQLRAPHPGWLTIALGAELAAMAAYARMQRRLLLSAGVRVPLRRQLALTYAAHSLSVTLPGGPAFSTSFNYQQMRRFGATPAVASWCIALSGILSAAALAVVTAAGALAAQGTPQWRTLIALTVAALLITVGVRRITRHPETLQPVTRAVLQRLNRLRHRPATYGLDHIRDFIDQLRVARLAPRHAAAAAVFAVLNWLLDAVCLWMCFHAVSDDPIDTTQVLLAFSAGMAAGTITVIPGGLGIIDSALILGLVTGGVDTPTAIATVVLYRIISFGFIIGAGWITWLIIRHRHLKAPRASRCTVRGATTHHRDRRRRM
ncbi:lysylphosphatidylglycerol synthase transmembrane domain-containing protein [Planosporangium sp. 12N6]|uniref:lysylphosphatidylglycerol synthase transmembrane domain-containing protein n=1 Tax=Planosporangium spinosum TaxID=3402278 RepID=UPI003CFA77E0